MKAEFRHELISIRKCHTRVNSMQREGRSHPTTVQCIRLVVPCYKTIRETHPHTHSHTQRKKKRSGPIFLESKDLLQKRKEISRAPFRKKKKKNVRREFFAFSVLTLVDRVSRYKSVYFYARKLNQQHFTTYSREKIIVK